MIVLKIEQTDKGPAILLTPEALELLGVTVGQQVGFQISEDGRLSIGALDASVESQIAHGREFMKRYDKTFQALAK